MDPPTKLTSNKFAEIKDKVTRAHLILSSLLLCIIPGFRVIFIGTYYFFFLNYHGNARNINQMDFHKKTFPFYENPFDLFWPQINFNFSYDLRCLLVYIQVMDWNCLKIIVLSVSTFNSIQIWWNTSNSASISFDNDTINGR